MVVLLVMSISTMHFWFQLTADVVGCNVYSDGSAAAVDTWNPSSTKTNVLDKDKVCSA